MKREDTDAKPDGIPQEDPARNPLLRIRAAVEDRRRNLGSIFREILEHYEKAEPCWFPVVLLTVVSDGLRTLGRCIQDPNDSAITWGNPAVEVPFPVDWNWEGGGSPLIDGNLISEEDPNRDVSPEFSAALLRYAWLSALSRLTLRISLEHQGEGLFNIRLPPKLLDAVCALPVSEQQAAVEELAAPVLIGAREVKREGFRLLMMDDPPGPDALVIRIGANGGMEPSGDGLVDLFARTGIPAIAFAGVCRGRQYAGAVILEFKPLTLDPQQRQAYFPLNVALAFRPAVCSMSDGDLVFRDPAAWNEEERRAFLRELPERIDECIDQLRRRAPETREMTAARIVQSVLGQRDEGVVVTVGRAPVSKVPVVDGLLQSIADFQRAHLKATGAIAPVGALGAPSAHPSTEQETQAKAVAKFPSPQGLKWADVTIAFISNDALLVETHGIRKRYHFSELGLCDRRVGDRPSTRWALLRKLATVGEISWSTRSLGGKERLQLRAVIKDLRKTLRGLMSIEDDPFEPYRRAKAYRPRFRLQDRTCGDGEISPTD